MRVSWMRRRAVARGAAVALAVGLSLLAALAVVSTKSTARSVASISATEQVSQQWSEVYLKISIEYEQLVDFLRADGTVGRQPLIASIGSAEANLRWLNAYGGKSDAFQARSLQNTYGGYSYTLRDLVDADQRGDRAQVMLDARQAALSASALRKQASVNIARKSLEMGVVLRRTQAVNHGVLLAVEVISGLDLALVGLCVLVLLAYQRGTERQAAESRYRACHDALTGVANRDLFTERIDEVLGVVDRDGGGAGLLLLDLNRFKEVNDTLGHHAGDLLLCEVARRLVGVARGDDLVARLGGDEFAVLLPDIATADEVLVVGERFLSALSGTAHLDGIAVDVRASIGAALYPDPSGTASELLQHADIAMYAAKRGHLGVTFYNPDADHHSFERLSVLGELRQAIETGGLVLHYQPKVRAGTHALCGVEALVRWRHPSRGLLGPDEFIPAAEQSDLIRPLTDVVLAAALAQHRAWQSDGLLLPVAVNVGAACLLDESFPARMATLLLQHAVTPGQLTVEITESAMVTDADRAASVLGALRELGIRLSIDDFGTGYSSMGYLQSMPLDELKIDRQFTERIVSTGSGKAIVGAIVELAHALGLEVVVEGVEDEETCGIVDQMGGEIIQGYLFSQPLPAEELSVWARQWDPRRAALAAEPV
jgi:diguanylate cyclase (GGDEF)-like protein